MTKKTIERRVMRGKVNMIEFYNKETGAVVDNSYDMYFVRGDGSVWRDNGESWESQCSVIGFEDCCEACPELAWRVVPNG